MKFFDSTNMKRPPAGPVRKRGGSVLSPPAIRNHTSAFTLIELLVVITIMGLLAAIGLPAIRGMSKSNAMAAADRQLLDDLAYARQRAMADHTTVYMVFVPTNITALATNIPVGPALVELYRGQFTGYAMLSLRSVGDQPGQSNPHYLTAWRYLPNGVFIPPQKFAPYDVTQPPQLRGFADPTGLATILGNTSWQSFPFPYVTNGLAAYSAYLPYIGFNYLGQLVTGTDEYIPLAHGSVFVARDAQGNLISQPADAQENPVGNTLYSPNYPNNNYNQIHIDWLTGRAKAELPQIQ